MEGVHNNRNEKRKREREREQSKKNADSLSGLVLIVDVQDRLDRREIILVDQAPRGERITVEKMATYKRSNNKNGQKQGEK